VIFQEKKENSMKELVCHFKMGFMPVHAAGIKEKNDRKKNLLFLALARRVSIVRD